MTLNNLAKECNAIARNKGFWRAATRNDYEIWLLSRLMLITTEVAEAAEDVRNNDYAHLDEELADILIRCFDLAGHLGTDLDLAVATKMEKNRNRPYMHGKNS